MMQKRINPARKKNTTDISKDKPASHKSWANLHGTNLRGFEQFVTQEQSPRLSVHISSIVQLARLIRSLASSVYQHSYFSFSKDAVAISVRTALLFKKALARCLFGHCSTQWTSPFSFLFNRSLMCTSLMDSQYSEAWNAKRIQRYAMFAAPAQPLDFFRVRHWGRALASRLLRYTEGVLTWRIWHK